MGDTWMGEQFLHQQASHLSSGERSDREPIRAI
jgi:hypothetical protein